MSNLFTNYQNINPNYQPSNIKPPNPCKPKLEPCKPNKPYEEYDAENKLVGYYWNYGDTINLEFDVSGEVTIIDGEEYISALDFLIGKYVVMTIYDFRGDVMATQTLYTSTTLQPNSIIKKGSLINGELYDEDTQVENSSLTILQESILKRGSYITKDTTVNNYIYEEDEEVKQEIRLHPGTRIIFEIDKALSNKLIKGVYTCTLILYNTDNSYVDTLFSQTDGNLIVK